MLEVEFLNRVKQFALGALRQRGAVIQVEHRLIAGTQRDALMLRG
jgi:hypothetical protein